MSQPDAPTSMGARMLASYRDAFERHADDPTIHACPHCRLSRCPEWRHARARLIAAGEHVDGQPEPQEMGVCRRCGGTEVDGRVRHRRGCPVAGGEA